MITAPLPAKIEPAAKMGLYASIIGVFAFGLDFATKFLTQAYLPLSSHQPYLYPYGGIGVFKNFLGIEFSINHATNRGAAWGMFAEYQAYLLVLRIVFVAGLLIYLLFYNKESSKQIPLALIVAGAVGNICDYFLYGQVIDMFHFILWGYDYPIFNVADSVIFVGIVWLFFQSLFTIPHQHENRPS